MLKAIKREERLLKKRFAPRGGTAAGQRARITAAKGYRRVSKRLIPKINVK
jgi:hypothetical protein